MSETEKQKYFALSEQNLERARVSLRNLSKGGSGFVLEKLWSDFVGDWHRSFNFLKLATKGGRSQQLHGRLDCEQRADKIVQFLYQSRDSKEHVMAITNSRPARLRQIAANGVVISEDRELWDHDQYIWHEGNIEILPDGTRRPLSPFVGRIAEGKIDSAVPTDSGWAFDEARLELHSVESYKISYDVPMQDICANERPFAIAKYGLEYLQSRLASAHELLFE